jgi:ferric-dicitrate binding protein FerR (iron transport regulator)
MAVSDHGKRAVEWRIELIDTPAMREAMQALQAALEEAERHLALYAFRRRSSLRLRAAHLARLQAALPGEST